MAIKNYTSNVSPFVSIGEIQSALAKHGATKVMIDYEAGVPRAVTFVLPDARLGLRGFRLPAVINGVMRVFKSQGVKADRHQAERTAWRNIRDWVLAQLALVESCDVPMDQVFLPYLADINGNTLYDAYTAGKLLPSGIDENGQAVSSNQGPVA